MPPILETSGLLARWEVFTRYIGQGFGESIERGVGYTCI